NVAVAGAVQVDVAQGETLDLSGPVSGAGSLTQGTEPGTLILGGDNNYAGGTTIGAGTLQLGNTDALGNGPLTVNGGAVDLNGFSPAIGPLSGAGGTITNDAGSGASTLIVDVNTPGL